MMPTLRTRLIALLGVASCCAPFAQASPGSASGAPSLAGEPAGAAAEELSLEELLARYKAERERLFESYRGRINALVADIETAYETGKKKRLAGFRDSLLEMGPGSAPLLVDLIDAGVNASEAQRGRARQITLVLAQLSTRAITSELLELFEKGTSEGKDNSLTVLANSDDPERVGPFLRERFEAAKGDIKGSLLATIAALGGERNEAFLGQVLSDKDPAVVRMSIEALISARVEAAAPRIMLLMRAPQAAAPHARQIVGYYRACPEVLDEDHCDALVSFLDGLTTRPDEAVLVLALLSDYHEVWGSKLKKRLKTISETSTPRIANGALIALARDGDRNAKKKLLEPYDDRIDDNELLSSAWESRADIRYLIGDYKNAIKDYTEALRKGESFGRPQPDSYIGLAKSYAQLGKQKDAAEWLDKAPISISKLRALATEPVFAELVASDKYRHVFHLEES